MKDAGWIVEVGKLPLPPFPLTEGTEPEGSVAFLGKKVADSEHAALAIVRRVAQQVPGITITGPNGERWGQAEILRRL